MDRLYDLDKIEPPLPPDLGPPLERDPVIEVYKKDVDRTLFRRNLTLTIEQRMQQLLEMQRLHVEARRAVDRAFAEDPEAVLGRKRAV